MLWRVRRRALAKGSEWSKALRGAGEGLKLFYSMRICEATVCGS